MKTPQPPQADNADSELEKALLGFKGGYGGHSLNSIMSLIQQDRERVREEMTPVTIMGKTLEEVVVILSALELERIADMKMTMSKLDDWMKLVREDHRKATERAIKRSFDSLSQNIEKDTG
jgi:PHD/YefM family antitoxin component YafN of YafNO toxin-antitoxin module